MNEDKSSIIVQYRCPDCREIVPFRFQKAQYICPKCAGSWSFHQLQWWSKGFEAGRQFEHSCAPSIPSEESIF